MAGDRRLALLVIYSLSFLGIAVSTLRIAPLQAGDLCGSDFPVFYAGGELVGTDSLYSAAAAQSIQRREVGCTSPSAIFIRLPYFAALMWPWAKLPFWTSFVLWRAASLAAIGVFIWLWPSPREWSVLACSWSLALAFAITTGQDICFLLAVFAVARTLWTRGSQLAAGMVLSLCAAKFHLFVFIPLVFWPGMKRTVYGMALGAGLLLAMCFAVQGPHWPGEFLGAALDGRIDPVPGILINLRGIAHGIAWVEGALAATVVVAGFYVFRRGDLEYKFAFALLSGLLLSRHQTYSDTALLIPVALILGVHGAARYSRLMAAFLVCPVASVLIRYSEPMAEGPRLLLLALAWVMAWETVIAGAVVSTVPSSVD